MDKHILVDAKQIHGFTIEAQARNYKIIKEQFLKDIVTRCLISDNIHNLTPIERVVEEVAVTA